MNCHRASFRSSLYSFIFVKFNIKRFLLSVLAIGAFFSSYPGSASADSTISVTVPVQDAKNTYTLPNGTHFDGNLEEAWSIVNERSLTRKQTNIVVSTAFALDKALKKACEELGFDWTHIVWGVLMRKVCTPFAESDHPEEIFVKLEGNGFFGDPATVTLSSSEENVCDCKLELKSYSGEQLAIVDSNL